MSLYDEFYPLAIELLTELGTDATLIGTAPTDTSLAAKRAGRVAAGGQPQGRPTKAVVGPIEVTGSDGRKTLQSVATMLAEPHQGDTLTMGSLSWQIGKVTRIAPQGQAIVYIAEVA
ncbi:hypothetical protein [Sphingomonas sp. R1]|uniref:hypothetical protein n=1 Tax=Sphingomonas sp. R1 TaxID=399176 RepID=UPI0022245327|nr:hypothetical protein [Sphingomonas sp. R1]UYY77497.1 hypothetical protein OIM94_00340 [Sphingomonas sp. R1]